MSIDIRYFRCRSVKRHQPPWGGSVSQVQDLINRLIAHLKATGRTYKDVANTMGVSESTLRRWMSQGSFSIERLDDLCAALAIDLESLMAPKRQRLIVRYLNEAQELELVADEAL